MALTEDQNQSIRAFHAGNGNNPAAIAAAQAQYGVSPADYAAAIAGQAPSQSHVDALTADAVRLQNAHEGGADYGNTQSKSYKAYADARVRQQRARELLNQQQYLADTKAGKFGAFEVGQGMQPGQLFAGATGQQSFVQPAPVQNPNDRTVIGGGLIGQASGIGFDQKLPDLTQTDTTPAPLINGVFNTTRRI